MDSYIGKETRSQHHTQISFVTNCYTSICSSKDCSSLKTITLPKRPHPLSSFLLSWYLNLNSKPLRKWLIFPWVSPMYTAGTCVNKFVCFSLVNLSSITGVSAKDSEDKGKIIFLPSQYINTCIPFYSLKFSAPGKEFHMFIWLECGLYYM